METRTKVTCLYTKSNTWKTKFPSLSAFEERTVPGNKFQLFLQVRFPLQAVERQR